MNAAPDNPTGLDQEPLARSPLWLQYSGLPEWLNQKVSRSAWTVFKTVVELDCARNSKPATVEVTVAQLARLCGLDAPVVARTLEGLRKKKCLALFLPEHPEEEALVEVKTPLPLPRPLEEIRAEFPFNRLDRKVRLRYGQEEGREEGDRESRPAPALQRVLDLYFNQVGFKMNSFILDELRLVAQRFPLEAVEKTFARAAKHDIRSLGWVVRELYREDRRKS